MEKIPKEEIEKILKKYRSKMEKDISSKPKNYISSPEFSREYQKFKDEATLKRLSNYEKVCSFSEKIIKVKPPKKDLKSLEESIRLAHINVTPQSAASFSILIVSIIVLFTLFMGLLSYLTSKSFGLLIISLILTFVAILMIGPLTRIPINVATKWRLKVSDQMVLCILYMVIYMRHTSNLENAIKFASEHIGDPLALDMRKVFWDVETGRYSTLKESLENYLGYWRKYNLEFVNAIHLLESSLYEPSEQRRLDLLDKSLSTILEGTYDRMLRYAHELQNPITMLHMLGVILPILGLVIFPLIGTFLGGVKWFHLAILYNFILPILVYNVGMNILSKRPAGYGEDLIDEKTNKGYLFIPCLIFVLLFFIGILPFIVNIILPGYDFSFWMSSPDNLASGEKFLDFVCNSEGCSGPYGFGALLLSFFVPLSLAFSLSMYNKSKSKGLIKVRDETKRLEKEFSTGIFQLGTRIGDGIPSELAFRDVSKTLEGTPTGNFFKRVQYNLSNLGMSLKNAIFNNKNGAIKDYPSPLVRSSMEILVESSKKGPEVVSKSLLSISSYVNNVHKINERLKDLLAEILSSMKSQIKFMAPVIAGIVVGIASMIVGIISRLGDMLNQVNTGSTASSLNLITLNDLFVQTKTIPGYFFQVVVGIYVVQIVYILTILSNGIEYGSDKLNEQHNLGKNLLKSVLLYVAVALVVVLLFNRIALSVLVSTQI